MKKFLVLAAVAATVAAVVVVPQAGAHATVTLMLPQGKSLTAASGTYVLRVPNERSNKSTYKVIMTVPDAVQQGISVRGTPDWDVTLDRVDTGQKNASGDPIMKTTKITWRAKPGNLIKPGMYGVFEFRFSNPATPMSLCFSVDQLYNGSAKGVPAETVSWSGAPGTATPASCVAIVTS